MISSYKAILLPTIVVPCCFASAAAGQDVLLYSVDFSSPLHTLGQPPAVGLGPAPRQTPTALLLGGALPRVVPSIGPLIEQPMELSPHPLTSAEYARFGITGDEGFAESFPVYRVEFDLVITEPGRPFGGGFTLFADVPTVRPIRWRSEGFIEAPDMSPSAAWEVGALQQVSTLWDLDRQRVTLEINGMFVDEFAFAASGIRSFRVSAGNNPNGSGPVTLAGVDNIRIWGIVPGTWTVTPMCMLAIVMGRRRRASGM